MLSLSSDHSAFKRTAAVVFKKQFLTISLKSTLRSFHLLFSKVVLLKP